MILPGLYDLDNIKWRCYTASILTRFFERERRRNDFFLIGIQVQPTGATSGLGGKPPRAERKEAAVRPRSIFSLHKKRGSTGVSPASQDFFCGRAITNCARDAAAIKQFFEFLRILRARG
jgi:hypothetical protein